MPARAPLAERSTQLTAVRSRPTEPPYTSVSSIPVGGVAVFALDPASGIATQLAGLHGCNTADGSSGGTAGQCIDGTALSDGYGMSVTPDGCSVYQATDDLANAGLAVYARETAPVCQATTMATAFRSAVTVSLHCADADGDAVTRSIVSGPAHGTLSAIDSAAGTVTYAPASGFTGTDSFTFDATDGVNSSAPAAATITVRPPPAVAQAAMSSLGVSPSKSSRAGRKVKGRCVRPTKANDGHKHCQRAITLRVSYTLNVADTVVITLQRGAPGRKVNGRCVKPTRHNSRRRKCTRLIPVPGQLVQTGHAGANQMTFNAQIGGRTLGPGSYQLIATPAGGTPRTVTFKIMR